MREWLRRKRRTAMTTIHPPKAPVSERPNVEKARADLARVRAQRPDVEALVTALILEKHLNNFSANLTATFRGGRL